MVGVAVVLAILSRRTDGIWREGALGQSASGWAHAHGRVFRRRRSPRSRLLIYAVVASRYSRASRFRLTSLVQLVQAKTFASGSVSGSRRLPTPEFYSVLNMVDANGRYYGQFPPGGPAMLALGVARSSALARGTGVWRGVSRRVLVVPACRGATTRRRGRGGVAVRDRAVRRVHVGSHMNHVPTLMWLCSRMACDGPRDVVHSTPCRASRWRTAVAFGCAATIRPVDAFAFALPAGVWYLSHALGDRARWRDAIAAACRRRASALRNDVGERADDRTSRCCLVTRCSWGRSHDLGFHRAPWGIAHTPDARARARQSLLSPAADLSVRIVDSLAGPVARRAVPNAPS